MFLYVQLSSPSIQVAPHQAYGLITLSSKASSKWSFLLTWTNIDKVVAIASLQPFDHSWMRRFYDLQHHKHMCGFNFLSTTIALKLWAHYKLQSSDRLIWKLALSKYGKFCAWGNLADYDFLQNKNWLSLSSRWFAAHMKTNPNCSVFWQCVILHFCVVTEAVIIHKKIWLLTRYESMKVKHLSKLLAT